jgi:3-oxoacid CoA-transferase
MESCNLPLTGKRVVDRIITEIAVFDINKVSGTMTLSEVAEGISVEEVKSRTGCAFTVADDLKKF